MTFSDLLRRLRVEDLICVGEAMLLGVLAFAGWNPAASIPEDQFWLLNFILLPVAVLTFISSIRYAARSEDASAAGRFAVEVFGAIRDWLPFAVFLMFYAVFLSNVWERLSPATFDAQLLHIDRLLLGETPAVIWQKWTSVWLTEILSFCYFLHMLLPPLIASICYRRDLRLFRQFLIAVMIAGCIGTACYALLPAIGPAAAFPQLFHSDLQGRTMRGVTQFIDQARAPRDIFPSLHVGVSALVLYYAFRRNRGLGFLVLPFVLGNWISTMYLRYHYFIDVIAGLIDAAIAIALAAFLLRVEERLRNLRRVPSPEPVRTP